MTNLAIALMLALQSALPGVGQDRLRVVSEDMVSVVNEEFRNATLKSDIQESEALAMLAAVAVGESGLRKDIENCKTTGDGGKSVGLGQVMVGPNWKGYTRKQICSDRKIQFRLALHVIDLCWARTHSAGGMFRCYTAGDPRKDSYSARHELATYSTLRRNVRVYTSSQKLQTCYLGNQKKCYTSSSMSCEL